MIVNGAVLGKNPDLVRNSVGQKWRVYILGSSVNTNMILILRSK